MLFDQCIIFSCLEKFENEYGYTLNALYNLPYQFTNFLYITQKLWNYQMFDKLLNTISEYKKYFCEIFKNQKMRLSKLRRHKNIFFFQIFDYLIFFFRILKQIC